MSTITGTIGGQSVEGYVRELHRRGQLCAPGQTVTLNLSTDFPIAVDTAMEVSLQEDGTQTFTGYVVKSTRQRPTHDWIIESQDTYQRATSFFIEDPMVTGYDEFDQPVPGYVPQSTDYWIGWLMGLCGMSYNIRDVGRTVPQGVQMGLRTVHESLTDVLAFASQYAFPDEYGVLQIGRAVRNMTSRSVTGPIRYERKEDDEFTRTTAKVFGYAGLTGRVFATASADVPNIVPERITAVSSPMIETASEAQRVADYLIDELGAKTVVVTATIPGDPTSKIGQAAQIVHEGYDDTDVITSLETDWTEEGYLTQITIGERCPRISGWSKLSPPLYAGTFTDGIYRSTDGGLNWSEFNTGLPDGDKYVTKMGFNYNDEGMAIVNGLLYYTDGESSTWSSRSLPSPSNGAGDDPAIGYGRLVAVDATGTAGEFAVLTTNGLVSTGSDPAETRSWIYTCDNSGSTSGDWTSTPMTTGSATSRPYNLKGWDLTASGGFPVAVLSSGSVWATVPVGGWRCEKVTENRTAFDYWAGFSGGWKCEAERGMSWGVSSIVKTITDTYISIDIMTGGLYTDFVYLYGSAGPRNDVSLTDAQGYRYWSFTSDAIKIGPTTWRTTVVLNHQYWLWPSGAIKEFFFNIFHCSNNALPPYGGITEGDVCGSSHVLGSSPYGDRRGSSIFYPMPIISTLLAGYIYWG